MRLRTFTAPKMDDALRLIRTQLGPDALILSTRKITSQQGHPTLEITAALPEDQPLPAPSPTIPAKSNPSASAAATASTPPSAHPLESALLAQGLAPAVVGKLLAAMPGLTAAGFAPADALEMLFGKLLTLLKGPELLTLAPMHIWVGPHGSGKSTAICQWAAQLRSQGRSLGLVSFDDQKLGGQELIAATGEILSLPTLLLPNLAELRAAREHAPPHTVWLVDTPSASVYQPDQLARSTQLVQVLAGPGQPLAVHLMAPAPLHPAELDLLPRAWAAQHPLLKPAHVWFSHLDATSRLGGALNLAAEQQLPVGLASHHPSPAGPPLTLTPRGLAEVVLSHPRTGWEFPA